jgi:hypothetical protein
MPRPCSGVFDDQRDSKLGGEQKVRESLFSDLSAPGRRGRLDAQGSQERRAGVDGYQVGPGADRRPAGAWGRCRELLAPGRRRHGLALASFSRGWRAAGEGGGGPAESWTGQGGAAAERGVSARGRFFNRRG